MSKTSSKSSGSSPKATPKPWEHAQGGVGSASDELAVRFVESLSYDRRLSKHDIAGSVAHARMLAKVGLISKDELGQIEKGLGAIRAEIERDGDAWAGWKLELEDVHMCIEAALIEKVGDAGRKLHTGRSRNDQVALDLKLWVHEAIGNLGPMFGKLFGAFVELAGRDGEIVMPSYTHLQRAQPIVVGGELIAWLEAFDRAWRRFGALWEVNKENPLGGGAAAGSGLPLDRGVTAESLPVGPPTGSSLDATASRDAALDMLYGLAMTAMTLSRWAEQWILYASWEFGFIKLDGRYTTGSSMMPQKQNPDMLELIRGRCGNVYGNLVALLTICKGLPIGYNRDLQEDKRQLFAAYDLVMDCLDMAGRIVATAKFQGERIAHGLERGFLDATSLAEYLVTRGVPFRTAHQVVGSLVHECQTRGVESLAKLPPEVFTTTCKAKGLDAKVIGPDMAQWLGAEQVVRRYQTLGNAGVEGYRREIKRWRERLAR
ncbi:MAG: argininosuccinate lyase [Phycisphaeraceae bacterium]|nr:argininosuccinate lyase [Phycisphaeraceae bacterium]